MQVAIIDYGMGNLKSVKKAFEALGVEAEITRDSKVIKNCSHLVLPGVGAFEQAMRQLEVLGLKTSILNYINENKPFLGICLGMQLLFEKSYENGEHQGLGILKGEVIRLEGAIKVPHMGWNTLEFQKQSPLFFQVPNQSFVYFVHSYHIETPEDIVISYTTYGKKIPVAIQKNKVFAMQFHPEKSGEIGMQLLRNFIKQ